LRFFVRAVFLVRALLLQRALVVPQAVALWKTREASGYTRSLLYNAVEWEYLAALLKVWEVLIKLPKTNN